MVSVVIPCHNCESFIERAVNSVVNQSIKDVEIILVENNSTDNTLQALLHQQRRFPELIQILKETKKGAPAARNLGLRHAKGTWIQFLDADDELLPNKIYRQLQVATETNADVIAGECTLKYLSQDKEVIRRTDNNVWKGLITSNLGITSSNLWRTSSVLAVKGWDEDLSSSQEYDLLFRLLKSKAVVSVDKTLNTIVHFSENSVSKTTDKEKLKKILNNRIQLRLRIKNELRYRTLLTRELHSAIDNYIYTEITNHYASFPAYANSLLQQYNPKVGLLKKMKFKTKLYLRQLK
ncbi:glycosyltransferase family 2 protein [Mucilaginibacter psychrotolerans]|uniref:Glycosyltransferase family 2 protein n=1 Tax=Mucilaginibacter psychrotolerans TaxID=1524096 RepID=A0A4Y8SMG1_9SPHI|nr:glycosyltransferase family 2 protein [Mucilaginibacter psychrotolerans]TFF39830.1 glycosyltransferase family 2 protein [Mucilaginibacter psychrotolerans]